MAGADDEEEGFWDEEEDGLPVSAGLLPVLPVPAMLPFGWPGLEALEDTLATLPPGLLEELPPGLEGPPAPGLEVRPSADDVPEGLEEVPGGVDALCSGLLSKEERIPEERAAVAGLEDPFPAAGVLPMHPVKERLSMDSARAVHRKRAGKWFMALLLFFIFAVQRPSGRGCAGVHCEQAVPKLSDLLAELCEL